MPRIETQITEEEIERSQRRLASLFGDELTCCPACGELIFAETTLPCVGADKCAARMGVT
jgi:hypothetical protein